MCRALYFRQIVRLFGGQLSLKRQVGHSDHRIHRGPDFVTHVGQKIRFGFGGFLRYLFGAAHLLFGDLPAVISVTRAKEPCLTPFSSTKGVALNRQGTFTPSDLCREIS